MCVCAGCLERRGRGSDGAASSNQTLVGQERLSRVLINANRASASTSAASSARIFPSWRFLSRTSLRQWHKRMDEPQRTVKATACSRNESRDVDKTSSTIHLSSYCCYELSRFGFNALNIAFTSVNLDDAAARQAVRDTWLSMSTENEATMRYAFAIGVKDVSDETRERLNDENVEHRDILLIERLVDSYQNLAKKTAYTIKSAVDYYDFKYLLKTDTDSYVRVGHLLKVC